MTDKKKKILILNYEFPPLGGGAGNATYYLLKELAKCNDVEIDLVTSSLDKFKTKKFSPRITIHYLNINKGKNLHFQTNKELLTYSWRAYWYCKKLAKEKQFDLVHAFFGIPCGYIAYKLGLPYIVSLRGSDVPFYNKRFEKLDKFIFQKLSRKIWRAAKSVVVNSNQLKILAQKTLKIDFPVIYNGVDISEFQPKKTYTGKDGESLHLISTGRLIQRKGFQYLIPALEKLPVKLTLIGGGNYRQELEKLAKTYKVNVEFKGDIAHTDIATHLQKADIFVLPSLNEGMSNSILEAIACGLPVITTNTGGSEELVNGNGFIVKKASPDQLRDKLLEFLQDKHLIKKMATCSRKISLTKSWASVAAQYLKEY